MMKIADLHLAIDGKPILTGIDTTIPETGLTALIGPNGAGKSSLLYCLAGLDRPTQGAVLLGDQDVAAMRPDQRARQIALLPQENPAPPRLSVADLVSFGRWPHHRGRPTETDQALVKGALADFDLGALATRRLDSLSGGQRQRALVAMAHAQATPWMLLDEPLAALDPKYASDIMARLSRLARNGQTPRAITVVMHDLVMAARHADWVLCLKNGRLIHSGPAPSVMTGPVLSDLFDTPIEVARIDGQPVPVILSPAEA